LPFSAAESTWGTSNIVTQANNYFGLHAGAAGASGTYTTSLGANVSTFTGDGYLASGNAFVAKESPFASNAQSAQQFFADIHANGYGVGTANYVAKMMKVLSSVVSRMGRLSMIRRGGRASVVLIALIVGGLQRSAVEARVRDLTPDEARRLIVAALRPSVEKLPKFGLDAEINQQDPDFYRFDATWDNPTGSVVIGSFGVNKATGDVWELVPCRRMGSSRLRRLQDELRRKIDLKSIERRQLNRAPCEN
jgi:hypothetical protein